MTTWPPEPDDTDSTADTEGAVLFDAILEPHRSLSRHGFVLLMAAVAIVGFVAGGAFMLMGAWPVMGLFGLDILLIYVAFKINYRGAQMYETVRLTEGALLVVRVNSSGQIQTWRFQPYWLRVDMDNPAGNDSTLMLSSHGRSLIIGSFLSPDERLEFAQALSQALYDLREAPPQTAA